MAFILPGYAPFRTRNEARAAARTDPGLGRALYQHRLAVARLKKPMAAAAELRGHGVSPNIGWNRLMHHTYYTVPATQGGINALRRVVARLMGVGAGSYTCWLSAWGRPTAQYTRDYLSGVIDTDLHDDKGKALTKIPMRLWVSLPARMLVEYADILDNATLVSVWSASVTTPRGPGVPYDVDSLSHKLMPFDRRADLLSLQIRND